MSVKLVLLKSGETLISDAKEVVSVDSETNEKTTHAYLFKNPHRVNVQKPIFSSDEKITDEVEISLVPWILLSEDKEIQVYPDWVVTIVEPVESIKKLYEEKVNGEGSKVSFTEE